MIIMIIFIITINIVITIIVVILLYICDFYIYLILHNKIFHLMFTIFGLVSK